MKTVLGLTEPKVEETAFLRQGRLTGGHIVTRRPDCTRLEIRTNSMN